MASINDCRGDACVAPTTVNEMTICDLRPYLAYKPSGVEWLGDVPAHWEVKRIKNWLEVNQISLPENTDPDYTFDYLDIGSVGTGRLTTKPERIRFGASPSRARRVVRPGDTVVSTVRTYLKAVWHAEDANTDLIASTGFAVLTPKRETSPKFVSYVCQSDPFTNRVTAESVGIAYPAIAETRLGTFDVCIPPLPEQTAIVRFLDHADRRIRRYIRAKQKLIALLEEQKQAIIHQAVTGHIDVRTGQPYPAYKPSGIEWLGDVPAHWDGNRLKSLVSRIDQGVSPQADNHLADDAAWGVLKAGCVNGGVFKETEHKRLTPDFVFDPVLAVAAGDVLISRASGSPRLVGSVGRVTPLQYKLILSDKTFRPIFRERVDPDFMVLAMNGRYYRQQVEQAISGAEGLANNLPLSSLRAFRFVVPPLDEQRVIVRYLRTSTSELNTAAAQIERQTALLSKYRTRLIADVVTGKFDVRDAPAALCNLNLPKAKDEHIDLSEKGH